MSGVTATAERTASLGASDDGHPYPLLRERFVLQPPDRLLGWLGPLGVALLALAIRVWHLGTPHVVLFDETYYAKDAYSLLQFGYVREFTDSANRKILNGRLTGIFEPEVTQIVHPDGGKWLIAAGEKAFGLDPFGWRIAAAVVGALTVLVLARLVRRLTGSTLLGCLAGLMLAVDGLHFVMSRLALLDGFMAFWLVCATACLVADRDWGRARLARVYPTSGDIRGFGPVRALLWRPWRLGAGVCFGLACGTKWSAVYVLAVFGLLVWVWDAGARRAIGVRAAWAKSLVVDAIPAFVMIVGVALVAYLLTWTGWLVHYEVYEARFGHGYGDNAPWGAYLDSPARGFVGEALQGLRSLWHYHVMVYGFHVGDYLADQSHPYESNPLGWLVMNRPVGIDAQLDLPPGEGGCEAARDSTCLRQVLALGNPVLWWGGAIALIACLGYWLLRRDWRFAIPVLGVAATWLPWFRYDDRPIFFFYAVSLVPFTVIGLALVFGKLLGTAGDGGTRRLIGTAVIVVFVAAELACFVYYYPIWADSLIPREAWQERILLPSWV
ncbi:phospholipid carrier-dependent glycosyltransferase [soil metagenome]